MSSNFKQYYLEEFGEAPPGELSEYGIFTGKKKELVTNIDFDAGIVPLDKVSLEMDHTYEHGDVRGETTHITEIDPLFTWRKGELTGVTGWPQMGKTEGTLFLMLLKAVYVAWRWIVFSPENYPAKTFYNNLIHTYLGQTVDKQYRRASREEYRRGKEFIKKHFLYIYPKEDHTPDLLRAFVQHIIESKKYGKFDGTLKDPWNKMTHIYAGREDQYLASQFPLEQRMARELNLCSIITAHPNGSVITGANGKLKVPDQFNISGGTMWNNMFDNILAWHRPDYLDDKASTLTEFHSHKIKFQKLVGLPGCAPCEFDRSTARYLFNGIDPFIAPGLQPGYATNLIPLADAMSVEVQTKQIANVLINPQVHKGLPSAGGFDDAPLFKL